MDDRNYGPHFHIIIGLMISYKFVLFFKREKQFPYMSNISSLLVERRISKTNGLSETTFSIVTYCALLIPVVIRNSTDSGGGTIRASIVMQ
jgi:hypothetical protein